MIPEEKLEEIKRRVYQNKIRNYKRHLINKKDDVYNIRNLNLNLVRISNRKINCVRIGSETLDHAIEKLKICYELQKLGHYYITEAIFENGARCDIFDLDRSEIYEILKSEKMEDCKNKVMNYPKGLKMIFVKR